MHQLALVREDLGFGVKGCNAAAQGGELAAVQVFERKVVIGRTVILFADLDDVDAQFRDDVHELAGDRHLHVVGDFLERYFLLRLGLFRSARVDVDFGDGDLLRSGVEQRLVGEDALELAVERHAFYGETGTVGLGKRETGSRSADRVVGEALGEFHHQFNGFAGEVCVAFRGVTRENQLERFAGKG